MTDLVGSSLTLVSLFIGFPKSHSTWEPLVFAWHLICKRPGVLGQTTLTQSETQTSWRFLPFILKSPKPAAGFWSLRRAEWVGE